MDDGIDGEGRPQDVGLAGLCPGSHSPINQSPDAVSSIHPPTHPSTHPHTDSQDVVRNRSDVYSEAVLGKTPKEYSDWIMDPK